MFDSILFITVFLTGFMSLVISFDNYIDTKIEMSDFIDNLQEVIFNGN